MRFAVPTISGFILAAILLTGCTVEGSPEPAVSGDALTGVDVSDASEAQTAEVADRVATADEYQAAFQRYRECLSAAGYELTDVRFENSINKFGTPSMAVDSGADETCYSSEYKYTDILWQSSAAVQDDSETAELLAECLTSQGIQPEESLSKMEEQLGEAGIEITECL